MKQVLVDPSFWALFPDAQINILYADGINNHSNDDNLAERQQLLSKATTAAGKF